MLYKAKTVSVQYLTVIYGDNLTLCIMNRPAPEQFSEEKDRKTNQAASHLQTRDFRKQDTHPNRTEEKQLLLGENVMY